MDIGIIGSADGPTSVLVAGPGFDLVPFVIAAAVLGPYRIRHTAETKKIA